MLTKEVQNRIARIERRVQFILCERAMLRILRTEFMDVAPRSWMGPGLSLGVVAESSFRRQHVGTGNVTTPHTETYRREQPARIVRGFRLSKTLELLL